MVILLCIVFTASLFSCKTSKDQSKDNLSQTNTQQQQQEQAEQKTDSTSNTSLEAQIVGNWAWWKTNCCGRTPHTETSESLKEPKVLKFQPDGVLQYFSGTKQTSSKTYKISYGLMNDERPIINIEAGRPGMLFIKGDTLIIDYGYMDLQTEFYLRAK